MNAHYDLMRSFIYVCILFLAVSPLFTLIISRGRKWLFPVAIFSIAVSLGILWLVAYVLDDFGLSVSWLFFASFFILASALDLPAVLRHRSKIGFTLLVLFAAGILAFYFFNFSPTKPFRRFYNSVQIGMTKDEVLERLHSEFPVGGQFPFPVLREETNRLGFILDPTKQAYNAEGVFLDLQKGCVASKTYSAD